MQALRQAAMVFSIACIGTELLTRLTGTAWSTRCIKGAAGLYILVVLFSLLPVIPAAFRATALQAVSDVPSTPVLESAEAQILARAEEQLEKHCAAQCRQRFGTDVHIELTLEPDGQEVLVAQVAVTVPSGCDATLRQSLLTYLYQELGVMPTIMEEPAA